MDIVAVAAGDALGGAIPDGDVVARDFSASVRKVSGGEAESLGSCPPPCFNSSAT